MLHVRVHVCVYFAARRKKSPNGWPVVWWRCVGFTYVILCLSNLKNSFIAARILYPPDQPTNMTSIPRRPPHKIPDQGWLHRACITASNLCSASWRYTMFSTVSGSNSLRTATNLEYTNTTSFYFLAFRTNRSPSASEPLEVVPNPTVAEQKLREVEVHFSVLPVQSGGQNWYKSVHPSTFLGLSQSYCHLATDSSFINFRIPLTFLRP